MPCSKDTAAAFKHFYADAVIFYSCHFEAAPPTSKCHGMRWDGSPGSHSKFQMEWAADGACGRPIFDKLEGCDASRWSGR